jgi:transcriptional regulator with XRE-family HTH domain
VEREDGVFGQRLRSVRLHAGLSQSALETRSGIPKARLSRYENGHVLPSIETLRRLASALDVSEAHLLGDQRAVVEEFFSILFRRGIRIYSAEQAAKLANAVADIVESAASRLVPDDSSSEVATVMMNQVGPAEPAAKAALVAAASSELAPPA